MAVLGGRAIGLSSFPSSSSYLGRNSRATASSSSSSMLSMHILSKSPILRGYIPYSTVQESSRPTATAETKAAPASEAKPAAEAEPAVDAERKEVKAAPKAAAKAKPKAAAKALVKPLPQMMEDEPAAEAEPAADAEKKEVKAAPKAAAKAKPKAAAKAPVKPLPQMMEEDVIPSLKAILEALEDLSEIQLSFKDNKLEGSFLKKGNPYSFWAFFPSGVLTGPKGFSLSSYGLEASTVEPFLIDEKKITAKHIVFWVEKRLAAQGIIPVWKED